MEKIDIKCDKCGLFQTTSDFVCKGCGFSIQNQDKKTPKIKIRKFKPNTLSPEELERLSQFARSRSNSITVPISTPWFSLPQRMPEPIDTEPIVFDDF